jgi:hypothetical protein
MTKYIKPILLLSAFVAAMTLSSCIPLAAGAAGGYMLKDEGYKVRSPIKKQ